MKLTGLCCKSKWIRPDLSPHCLRQIHLCLLYLMKGLVTARTVLMNHDGWRIMKDFKFFLSLKKKQHVIWSRWLHGCVNNYQLHLLFHSINKDQPSVDHLIAFLQPSKARHSSVGRGSIQVHNHIVLGHHQLQCADHVADLRQIQIQPVRIYLLKWLATNIFKPNIYFFFIFTWRLPCSKSQTKRLFVFWMCFLCVKYI